MKFLVMWKVELSRVSTEMMKSVLTMPEHAKPFSHFTVYPLADMSAMPLAPPAR